MPAISDGSVTRRAFLSAGGGLAGGILLGTAGRAMAQSAEPAQFAEAAQFAESAGGAKPGRPRVYTRDAWGAASPKNKALVLDRAPDRIVIHHTATANTGDRSLDAAFRLSQAIQRYHMKHNGWEDIGEHFTVSRGGHILEGRNRTLPAIAEGKLAMGAQTANHNRHTMGVETEGTYMTELPTSAQLASLTSLLAWLCGVYDLDPNVAIIGHRDLNTTSCPGDRLYGYLPQLRANVARRLGDRPSRARLAAMQPLPEPLGEPLSQPAPPFEADASPQPAPPFEADASPQPAPYAASEPPSPPPPDAGPEEAARLGAPGPARLAGPVAPFDHGPEVGPLDRRAPSSPPGRHNEFPITIRIRR
ncbi:N-acetylmuramoyl-L-alanine amidase [Planotetraspora sp. A-T 1434]|uniref:peptidoglycan recognition protein family protein n=1 Tax=Planotetraspora sp. A-T 1434 TaxID=2979219 RepID=UPI0021BF0C2D|nr:N-acetylmuramoyl-L-alanine amidase [Planotetraspora sp. A-T 1434]MCT9932704.1 N-acetylmuramoyl-L-alanine amidase [Planotetraspora sp. A-T 1434]